MKLMRIGEPGSEIPVVSERDDIWFDARPITKDFDAEAFALENLAALRAAIAAGQLPEIDVVDQRVGSPIRRAASVMCIGMNYAAHAAESGSLPPENVVLFFKKANTLIGPNDPIFATDTRSTLDWEVELGIVIGARLTGKVTDQEAEAAVAGYVLANDLSDRWNQLDTSGGQWSKGKCFESSCPLGPWVVTADEIADPQQLQLNSWVNGHPRQDSSTADMIFSVLDILRDLATVMVLEPGDLILTGTPEGVALSGRFPYLTENDTVRMTIEGLGEIDQRVHAPQHKF